ncbi:MAG: nucleoside-diphosphate kinase [Candidatus Cloacimonadales bacterium]
MIQTTLLLIKPNAVKNKNIGDIISIIEKDNFLIKDIKLIQFDEALINIFYQDHLGKPFFNELTKFMQSDITIAFKLERENAIAELRKVNGDANPINRDPSSIRALYADSVTANAVHSSDSESNAKRELAIIFG